MADDLKKIAFPIPGIISTEEFTPMTPPRQINDNIHIINVTGYIFAWKINAPVWLTLHGTNDLFLALFSTEDKFKAMASILAFQHEKLMRVDNAEEFIESIPLISAKTGHRLRIIIDPYIEDNDNFKFKEIIRE
jgi:hypothetical protein